MLKGTVRGRGTYKELEEKGVTLFNSIAQTTDTKMSQVVNEEGKSFESKIPFLENEMLPVRLMHYIMSQ